MAGETLGVSRAGLVNDQRDEPWKEGEIESRKRAKGVRQRRKKKHVQEPAGKERGIQECKYLQLYTTVHVAVRITKYPVSTSLVPC